MVFHRIFLWPHLPYLTASSKDGLFCFCFQALRFPATANGLDLSAFFDLQLSNGCALNFYRSHVFSLWNGICLKRFLMLNAMYGMGNGNHRIFFIELHFAVCAHAIYMHLQDCLYELVGFL